ncbi:MAG TPA: condensation domain-containing protein, partial [Longimicrobiaceae bacterium]|nr:condensation domain-containing protein [Longimicrobiaceae bacterium]
MTASTPPVAGLSRSEKQALLRQILAERISRPRTEPVSFAQERLWFLDRLHPGSAFYNLAYAFRLHGALDGPALERALGEIVRRHEPLRTTLQEREGAPVQVIVPFGGFALPVQDLSGAGEAAREAEAQRQLFHWTRRPFDLAAGPLFRTGLLRLGEEDHVLLLGIHHVVTDEWSMGVLFGELSTLYQAYREGRGSPLPELSVRYADYVVHQREQLRGEALERELSYWKARLSGIPTLLELPTDRPRPQVQSNRGTYEQAELPRDLLGRLKTLGHREGATLYMVVLSAFQVLLSKYSGSEDVVVGTSIAGRTRREVEELIGFFVNTLVLRTDLSGDPSLRDVLGRVREVTLGAYEHQEMPFDRLVAELQPERSLGHSPLFQVMFSQRDQEGSGPRLPGLRLHPLACDPDTVKFDLNLAFRESPDCLSVVVGYRSELFDRSTTRRMLAHLGRVLEQFAADPTLRFSELELLGEAERRVLVNEWNATDAEYPRGACIHELFEAQVERTPGAVAASCEGRTLSYAELDERSNRLAHYLAARGVGPEVRVGICMEPSLEMVVGVLATLKAGGAYVPLDPTSPEARLSMMLEDSTPAALLTQAALNRVEGGLLPKSTVQVVEVDAGAAAWAALPGTSPAVADLAPENLGYVIYTSGSTGRPKGVMVPHRGVCNAIRAFTAAYRIGEGARVLFFAPLHFDASVLDLFTALCSGATLVVASREAMMPGEDLLGLLRRERVTHAKFTPSALAATPWAELPELKTVISTGEACSAEVVARWAPGRRFLNGYGPTEASVRVTAHETSDGTRPPPIGRPVANVRLYAVDGWGNPV